MILPKVPNNIGRVFTDIVEIMEIFCKEKLNNEYYHLAVELAAKIARKRPSPFLSGTEKAWAAGIIHALGMVNFLFDKSQAPHLSSRELCDWFNLGQSTISAKSKAIRHIFKIHQLDPKWCLPSKLEDNPLVWMVSINGFIIDVRKASYDIQVSAYEAGIIPYIPGDKI
jgi:hypothetical protein